MKVSERYLLKSDGLVDALKRVEAGRKKMEQDIEKVNSELVQFYPQYERALVLSDRELIVETTAKLNDFYHRRDAIRSEFFRQRDAIIRELEQLNLPFISQWGSELLAEAKRIMALRDFIVVERKTNVFTEHGTVVYNLKHNYYTIQKAAQNLAEANKKIMTMRLSSLREIKEVYDKAMQIPEEFPLEDEKVCNGENEFFEFQGERMNIVYEEQRRYINFYASPGFIPSSIASRPLKKD